MPRPLIWVTLLVLGLLVAACQPDQATPPTRAVVDAPARRTTVQPDAGQPDAVPRARPNIVLITTDDQTVSDMQWMPATLRLIGRAGTTFTALSPHPLCCPARAEILTGQYAQNNGVQHNHGAYGGFPRLDADHTIAVWLQRAGYDTAFVGKYLNEYDGRSRPPGWTMWDATTSSWYSYLGTRFYGEDRPAPKRYSVDVVGDLTSQAIRRLSGDRPFFIWSSQVAPHAAYDRQHRWVPPPAATRHTDAVVGEAPSVTDPAFNIPGPRLRALQGERGLHAKKYIQRYFAQRIRSLMAVDEAVARTVRALRASGELRDTYVFVTSDNGYLLGEHALVGKNVLYRQSLEVPMLVRGPGVRRGRDSSVPVTLTDLAPTFLDIARARADVVQDGASFLPVLQGRTSHWRDTQLIQTGSRRTAGPSPGWSFRGVLTERYTFGVHSASGQTLLFDRRRDPHELRNVARDPAYRSVVLELSSRTRQLASCAGSACRRSYGPVPHPDRGLLLPHWR